MTDPDTAQADAPEQRVVFTVEAAAEALSMSRTRMFSLIKTGAVRSVRVGRLRRIPAEALNEYVAHLISFQSEPRHESQI